MSELEWVAGTHNQNGYIIEYENILNPLTSDTDSDGLGDADELILGTNPEIADSDGDERTDGDEVDSGTNPTLADTDGDGLSDGEEHSAGTNPLLVDTDGDGLSDYDELVGSVYSLVERSFNELHRSIGRVKRVEGKGDGGGNTFRNWK